MNTFLKRNSSYRETIVEHIHYGLFLMKNIAENCRIKVMASVIC